MTAVTGIVHELHPVPEDDSLWKDFAQVAFERRSIRKYTDRPISEKDMNDVLDAGIFAPNSSNLQAFEFVWVRSSEKKKELVKLCLNQSAARTAQELVVCVARWDQWNETRAEMAAWLKTQDNIPKAVSLYYERGAQLLYSQGPLGIAALSRKATATVTGLTRPVPRGPVSREDMRVWAVKSAALCCENMMLAARAKGFDSCPMEGNDSLRVGKLVGLKGSDWLKTWDIPMVISFGYRTERGVWGHQWRRDRAKLIREL